MRVCTACVAFGFAFAAGVQPALAEDQASTAAGAWSERAPLPDSRTEVSVTTDGSRIFLAGGFGPSDNDERATLPTTLWAYDPDADAWDELTDIPEGVHHAAFAYHESRLYILGGYTEVGLSGITRDVHIYDLEDDEWSEGEGMPTPRAAAGYTLAGGLIHVIGGNVEHKDDVATLEDVEITEDRSVNVHEAYDIENNRWLRLEPMPTPRNHLGAASHEGHIHAVLGRADGNYTLTTHEIYHIEDNEWRKGPAVPTGRSGVAVVAHDGRIYAFGGETFDEGEKRTFAEAERYDPEAEHWEKLPDMPTARHGLGAAAIDGGIHVISGGPEPALSFGDHHERLTPDD